MVPRKYGECLGRNYERANAQSLANICDGMKDLLLLQRNDSDMIKFWYVLKG